MPDMNLDDNLRSFLTRVRCCACGRVHLPAEIQVVNRRGESLLLKVYCPTCRTRSLVVTRIGDEQPATPREDRLYPTSTPLTIDDVLDIHIFLRDFHGDVNDLFRRR